MKANKTLLRAAASELKAARRENEILRARLSGFEDAMLLLKTVPNFPGQGLMSPDVVYDLEKAVASIEDEENAGAMAGAVKTNLSAAPRE